MKGREKEREKKSITDIGFQYVCKVYDYKSSHKN